MKVLSMDVKAFEITIRDYFNLLEHLPTSVLSICL